MRRERAQNLIVAVVFIISLTLAGIAEAGSLLAIDEPIIPRPAVREPIGLLDQGMTWLTELWSDFKAIFAEDTTGSGPTSPADCPPNTDCGDAGPGIDPEG